MGARPRTAPKRSASHAAALSAGAGAGEQGAARHLQPLLEHLRGPLDGYAGAGTLGDFPHRYLAAITVLEERVARGDGHPPMTRRDVALLCRCTLGCRDLAEAIACAIEFCAMLEPRAGRLALHPGQEVARFDMDSLRNRPDAAAGLVDITGLFAYLQLFGWLVDTPLQPRQVRVGDVRREETLPLLALFDAPLRFGEAVYGFDFDAALLARPVLRRPEELDDFLHTFPCQMLGGAALAAPLPQQVRSLLLAAIGRGQPMPEARQVAPLLGSSEATLRRRLSEAGTSFRELREQCLREAAERHLARAGLGIEQVAARLGFSDAASFRRAFRRWTGVTPSAWRRAAGG